MTDTRAERDKIFNEFFCVVDKMHAAILSALDHRRDANLSWVELSAAAKAFADISARLNDMISLRMVVFSRLDRRLALMQSLSGPRKTDERLSPRIAWDERIAELIVKLQSGSFITDLDRLDLVDGIMLLRDERMADLIRDTHALRVSDYRSIAWDGLVALGLRTLEEVYPRTIFGHRKDPGARFLEALRDALKEVT